MKTEHSRTHNWLQECESLFAVSDPDTGISDADVHADIHWRLIEQEKRMGQLLVLLDMAIDLIPNDTDSDEIAAILGGTKALSLEQCEGFQKLGALTVSLTKRRPAPGVSAVLNIVGGHHDQ